MDSHVLLVFVAASAVMGLAPGPGPSAALWMKRAGAGVLIAAGAATAVSRS